MVTVIINFIQILIKNKAGDLNVYHDGGVSTHRTSRAEPGSTRALGGMLGLQGVTNQYFFLYTHFYR